MPKTKTTDGEAMRNLTRNEVNEILIIDLNKFTYDEMLKLFNNLISNIISNNNSENAIYPIIRVVLNGFRADYKISNVKMDKNKAIEIHISTEEKYKRSNVHNAKLDIYTSVVYYNDVKNKKDIKNVENINIQIKIGEYNLAMFDLAEYLKINSNSPTTANPMLRS
ncbi:MAG: hypothetical protein ACP5UN_03280 [Candidatus Micrarchaeia archaeon]